MTARSAPGVYWRIGSHVFRADGTFWHESTFINLTPLQRRLLQCFCRHAGELIPRQQLANEAWNQSQVSDQSLARAIHGLRRVLDEAGLGGQHIATLYGSGYTFTAPVVEAWDPSPVATAALPGKDADAAERTALAREHHIEGRSLARSRNPALIPAALRHLRLALELDPSSAGAIADLCWVLLHQAGWGLVPSTGLDTDLRALLERVPAGSTGSEELHGVHAELVSLIDWKPRTAEPLFARAMATGVRRSDSTQSWARHLLATGRPRAALEALEPMLQHDLPHGWRLAALAHWHQNAATTALELLECLLALDPFPVSTHLMAAMLQAEQGRTPQAMEHLACARRPCGREAGFLNLHPMVAYVLALADGRHEAGLLLQRAAQHPGLPLLSLWGLAALELDKPDAARGWFERAVDQRCYQAPFVLHSPALARHASSPVVGWFRSAMAEAFA
jgi:DNA-binding winged helix-turn-helix (wHTH) protein